MTKFRHWLYGEKVVDNKTNEKKSKITKGWFPSKIVKVHPSSYDKMSEECEQSDDKKND